MQGVRARPQGPSMQQQLQQQQQQRQLQGKEEQQQDQQQQQEGMEQEVLPVSSLQDAELRAAPVSQKIVPSADGPNMLHASLSAAGGAGAGAGAGADGNAATAIVGTTAVTAAAAVTAGAHTGGHGAGRTIRVSDSDMLCDQTQHQGGAGLQAAGPLPSTGALGPPSLHFSNRHSCSQLSPAVAGPVPAAQPEDDEDYCQGVVEAIRRDEFGLGLDLGGAGVCVCVCAFVCVCICAVCSCVRVHCCEGGGGRGTIWGYVCVRRACLCTMRADACVYACKHTRYIPASCTHTGVMR